MTGVAESVSTQLQLPMQVLIVLICKIQISKTKENVDKLWLLYLAELVVRFAGRRRIA